MLRFKQVSLAIVSIDMRTTGLRDAKLKCNIEVFGFSTTEDIIEDAFLHSHIANDFGFHSLIQVKAL